MLIQLLRHFVACGTCCRGPEPRFYDRAADNSVSIAAYVGRAAAALLFLCAVCEGQVPAPIPANEVPQRKEILRNDRVTVSLLELAPHEATPMHRHDRDMLSVFLNGGRTQDTMFGHKPAEDTMAVGEVRFRNAGSAHAIKNEGADPFRVVIVELADPQGKMERVGTALHYCNLGSTAACVDEKNLFCTAKVCVVDVNIAPGAVTTKHSHATAHMLVAVSDYELTDEVEGKGTVVRSRKSGEVEYIPAGISHRQTNTGQAPARFTVILWR
jgi:quercetin dioxygenase-like cupin family protein